MGGGIYSAAGILTIDNSKVRHNSANLGGGIYNSDSLDIIDTTISDNGTGLYGAGIYNVGTLTVIRSKFMGNDAGNHGGGIYAPSSTSTIKNSTFYNNNADTNGAGVYITGGFLTVHNSTFSGNVVAGDGGGICNSVGTMYLENSILAHSSGGNDCYSSNTAGTKINNLIESGTCGSALSSDPLLEPLADNSGPTQTMALCAGSPAIDAGDNPTCEAADQRGWSRPIDGDRDGTALCDIGAFEAAIELFLPLIMRQQQTANSIVSFLASQA